MSGRNSAYSPLPQSNSDSDGSSEEELQVAEEDRVLNRNPKTQNVKTEKILNGPKPNVINYKLLNPDGDVGATLVQFQSTAHQVSILKPKKDSESFSKSRKIYFILSLFLCISTTVVFIWFLPCNVGACLSLTQKNGNLFWQATLVGLGKQIYFLHNLLYI